MDLPKLRGLSLFSGIGGDTLALSKYVNTIAYCERDQFCQKVLLSKMQQGLIKRAPIWNNIRTLNGTKLPPIDIIYGGSPCQQLSNNNPLGEGLEGKDSSLFFEIVRLTDETRPQFVFLENVQGIIKKGLPRIAADFSKLGYSFEWTVVSASQIGAPHTRRRWFALASSDTHENGCDSGINYFQ